MTSFGCVCVWKMQRCECCDENLRLKREVVELSEQLRLSKRLIGLLETGDLDGVGEVSGLLDCRDDNAFGHMKELAACDVGEGVEKVAPHS